MPRALNGIFWVQNQVHLILWPTYMLWRIINPNDINLHNFNIYEGVWVLLSQGMKILL